MDKIFILNSSYNSNMIKFEYDDSLGLLITFDRSTGIIGNFIKKIDYFNNSDFSIEVDLNENKQSILDLITFLKTNTPKKDKNLKSEFYQLEKDRIIVGCSCIGGINEHSLYFDYYNDDNDKIIFLKLNITSMKEDILLSNESTEFIINFLEKYVR